MEDIKKKIILNDGGIIKYVLTPAYPGCEETISITRNSLKGGIVKTIRLTKGQDISLIGTTTGEETEILEFSFDINDSFYSCFLQFLGSDKEFIIEDDETTDLRNKYLEIKNEDYCIKFVFHNYVYDDINDAHWERYRTFIKNYGPDTRSKIDNYDDKIRIINLFKNLEALIKDEYYQMTIQEYLERLNYQNDQKIKILKMKENEK